MSVIVVCDGCGEQGAERYYLGKAIGNGAGTKNIRKGDLCGSCVEKIPLAQLAGKKQGPHGKERAA